MKEDRFMWLMVFFDLPVQTRDQRRTATKFRQFLLRDGFFMMQFSVYARICNGQERVKKHLQRLQQNLPPQGSVRAMEITDLQFGRMKVLVGKRQRNERTKPEQLELF